MSQPVLPKHFSDLICRYTLRGLLILFVVFGAVVAFLLPPFQAPDENVHWNVGYARTESFFSLARGHADACQYAYALPEYFELGRIAFKPQERVARDSFSRIGELRRICATPQLSYGTLLTYPSITISRLLVRFENSKPRRALLTYYMARLLSGALIAFALFRLGALLNKETIVPGAFSILGLALSPLMIQQSFGVSADGITLGLAICLVSIIFAFQRITWLDLGLLGYFSVATAATKPPLLPLLLLSLPLLFLRRYSRSIKTSASSQKDICLIVIWLAAFSIGIWESSLDHSAPAHQVMGRDLSLPRQFSHLLHHPFSMFVVIWNTLWGKLSFASISGPLGWLDTSVSALTVRYWSMLLYLTLAFDFLLAAIKSDETRDGFEKWVIPTALPVISVFTSLLVVATLYLTWTPVGAERVDGIQPRYLLPGLLLGVSSTVVLAGGLLNSIGLGRVRIFRERQYEILSLVLPFFSMALLVVGIKLIVCTAFDLLARYW